jgi:hypothetical protein
MNTNIKAEDFYLNPNSYITEKMIEFAKFHVKAAIKAASEELPYDDKMNQDMIIKKRILNAYPLTNIK